MNERLRILITDDQKATRQGLMALLSFVPQIEIVGEAANGQEAVSMVEERRPDLVIMDIKMPVMDGFQATRLIKDRRPEIKIVALSIYAGYRDAALKSGADAFLVKGCSAELLQATILEAGHRLKLYPEP